LYSGGTPSYCRMTHYEFFIIFASVRLIHFELRKVHIYFLRSTPTYMQMLLSTNVVVSIVLVLRVELTISFIIPFKSAKLIL